MGNGGYNHHHHFQYQKKLKNLHNKSKFLPMLCSRNSMKDVAVVSSSSSVSFSNDPLSPKIGCMGQVKRNNKIIGFPPSSSSSSTTSHNHHINKLALTTRSRSSISITTSSNDLKNFKLKRFFSAKNIITNTAAAAATTTTNNNNSSINNSTSCTASSCRRRRRRREASTEEKEVCIINIAEMDPPLPVIKRDQPKPAADHLWKRRSNGGAFKSLELQQIEIPRYQIEIQTI